MFHGLLATTQDPPDGARIAERWQELLELAALAEHVGFDSFHLPEHHALEDGYLPQPLVACAAVAARTSRIGVGTALTVAPLRHPLHLAEEAAMVDVISGGRLLLALGSGNYRPEYELFDVPFEQQSSRFDELLTVLLRGLRGERFDHDGTHWQLRGAAVRPRPVQQPHPPVWVGAMSPRGVRRAAEHGLPLLLDPLSTIERLEELVAHYREHWTDTSREPEVMLMRWGWVGPREQVEEIWWPHVRGALWSYIVDIPRVSHASVDIRAATPDELDLETVAGERLLVGEAEEVRELAAEWVARLGASRLIIKLQGASGPWGEDLHAGVEAYARTFEERE